jgi:hypothetical protein
MGNCGVSAITVYWFAFGLIQPIPRVNPVLIDNAQVVIRQIALVIFNRLCRAS